jgi:ABC-type sugar transport system permease subunit
MMNSTSWGALRRPISKCKDLKFTNRKWQKRPRGSYGPLLFVLPSLAFYVFFVFIPVIGTVRYSLFSWDGASPNMLFVGLQNYVEMIEDAIFWKALVNNIIWTIGTLVFAFLMGLVLAVVLMQSGIKIIAPFRVAFFIPVVLSLVVIGTIWSWMYNPEFGTINLLLNKCGLAFLARPWLGNDRTVLFALVFAGSWHYSGFCMMVFIAGLQSIDPVYYEVGVIDGATKVRMFFFVTIPLLKNTMTLLIVNVLIWSLKIFDLVFIMTGGGPYHSSEVIANYMFYVTFRIGEIGYGAALATTLALLIGTLSFVYIRMAEKAD